MVDSPYTSNRPYIPTVKGNQKKDAPVFFSNGKIFEGFKDVSISKSMTALSGSFQIVFTDMWQVTKENFSLKSGVKMNGFSGKDQLLKGFVDRFNINTTPNSRNFTITGREITADLVDCSHVGNSEFNEIDILGLANQLCSKFGISVELGEGASSGSKFKKFTIRQGETVFEALNRAAKQREIILLTSNLGNLVLSKKGSSRSSTELVEGVNMEVTGVTFDNSDRFSEYIVKGQQPGLLGDPKDATESKATSKDSGIDRYRPLIIINDNSSDVEAAQKKANYENSYRAANGFEITCTVVGWRKKDGSLWKINELIPVKAPTVGIKKTLLAKSVTYNINESGESTDITLVREDAFQFDAQKDAASDPLSTLGWG